jgi:hypothetical protein
MQSRYGAQIHLASSSLAGSTAKAAWSSIIEDITLHRRN